jgi:hypothetical protein
LWKSHDYRMFNGSIPIAVVAVGLGSAFISRVHPPDPLVKLVLWVPASHSSACIFSHHIHKVAARILGTSLVFRLFLASLRCATDSFSKHFLVKFSKKEPVVICELQQNSFFGQNQSLKFQVPESTFFSPLAICYKCFEFPILYF